MTISIIIPVYNTAPWLKRCLDSVAAQRALGWECVLVDDGSTDGSGAMCDRRAGVDGRFRVIHTANRGVSAARNSGIEHARGEYLAFVDSDDAIDPDYLSTLLRAMEGSGAGLAVCGLVRVGRGGEQIVEPTTGVLTLDAAGAEGLIELNRTHLLYPPYSKLYRAGIVSRHAVRFPQGVHYGEDLVFNFRYLEHVRTIATVQAHGYRYRVDPAGGSLSASPRSRDHATNWDQWRLVRDFFARLGILDPAAGPAAPAAPAAAAAREFLSNRLWGIAYDGAMNSFWSPRTIGRNFSPDFVRELRAAARPTIDIPWWLRVAASHRLIPLIWLIQRRPSILKPSR